MFDRVIRIAYFDAAPASLVVDAIYPALSSLIRTQGTRAYLRTDWARGPHFDAVIESSTADAGRRAIDRACGEIRGWIERHPSTQRLPTDYLARSRRMADAEQSAGAIEPLYPNNHVFLAANEQRTLWGSRALGEAAAAFHSGVLSDVAQIAAARQRSRGGFVVEAARRLASVGHMTTDAAFAFWPASLSAHTRLFLTAHPSLRPVFEEAWGRLDRPVMAMVAELVSRPGAPSDLTGWIAAGGELDRAVSAIQADPDTRLLPVDVDNPLHIRDTLGSDEAVSARLTDMFDAERNAAVFASPLHHRFRIVVNLMYEALAAATISPVERALACYLITRAILADFPEVAARARDAVAEMAGATHA